MKTIAVCPSTLTPGFTGYSPRAIKTLFDGVAVSPIIDIDFERFAERIGLPKKRSDMVLDLFMVIPEETYALIDYSFLNDKMKRNYKRVIEERRVRFIRGEGRGEMEDVRWKREEGRCEM